MGLILMSAGISTVEMGSISSIARQPGSLGPQSAEDTISLQWQGRSANIILTSVPHCKHSQECVCVCRCVGLCVRLHYFSSCEVVEFSEGFFKGLIYAHEIVFRSTLEEGLT